MELSPIMLAGIGLFLTGVAVVGLILVYYWIVEQLEDAWYRVKRWLKK